MAPAKRPELADPAADLADEPDGRRRRSKDSRARIVAAMLALVERGELSPSAEQVADGAQVGLRTVFRHFKDMDSLYGEMARVIEGELMQIVRRPLEGETWRERLVDLIVRRTQAFEKIAPYRRASELRRHGSPFLGAAHERLVAALKAILTQVLPPEVAKDRLKVEVLDLLMSYEAWSRLRREQGLTARRAREVLEAAVGRLIEV